MVMETAGKASEDVNRLDKVFVGESKGSMPEDKPTWWYARELKEIVSKKKKHNLRNGKKP